VYLAHVGEWRQQFQRLDSVDLRYERQIIVNPDPRRMQSVAPSAPKPAAASGKKTVAKRTSTKARPARKKR
jgi:cell division protein FtsQ